MLYDDLGESMRTPDHPELCLAWEQGVNLWAEEAFRRMNTDESKVRSYELPPLPDTLEEWKKQRREVLQQFEECMYGQVPPSPDKLELKLLAENPEALGGLAIRREYRIFCRMNNGRSFDFDMMLYVPKNAKVPPPVFTLTLPGARSSSSWNTAISLSAILRKRWASPTARPLSFM